jgi:putative flippase GtrA
MRFWRFNIVGALGFVAQLGALALLLRLRVPYLAATALAVEAAVLHNFVWHERWTWRDRQAGAKARLTRLWRFHAINGVVSLAGNLLLMRLLVGACGVPPLPANVVAVAVTAVVNFAGADRLVFSHKIEESGCRKETARCAEV